MWTREKLTQLFTQRARLPSGASETMIDTYLSFAQERVLEAISIVAPQVNYSGLVQLSTIDGGESYTFGDDELGEPLTPFGHVEIRVGKNGRPLTPGNDFDEGADFVHEGDRIRFPGGRSKQFAGGLYARFVKRPPAISGTQEPTLKPAQARPLICYRALIEWATEHSTRDPKPFERSYQRLWHGDPTIGDHGILGMLRTQFTRDGSSATGGAGGAWWPVDDGSSYPLD